MSGLAALMVLPCPATADAGSVNDASAVPHIDDKGREGYRTFRSMPGHRAFAVAPGGAWGWSDSEASRERAMAAAVAACETYTDQPCIVYAVDDEVVFDGVRWSQLWGPYHDRENAKRAATGVERGYRFPDLKFTKQDGRTASISALAGKVVLLHFWGTWCTYCRPELTELQALHDELKGREDIEFALLQVREPYTTTRAWMDEQGFTLPQHDSGVTADGDEQLWLSDGSPIRDRRLALVFPTTYVLDKHGIVVFRRVGPAFRWTEYLPLLNDVADRSGR